MSIKIIRLVSIKQTLNPKHKTLNSNIYVLEKLNSFRKLLSSFVFVNQNNEYKTE